MLKSQSSSRTCTLLNRGSPERIQLLTWAKGSRERSLPLFYDMLCRGWLLAHVILPRVSLESAFGSRLWNPLLEVGS